VKAPPSKKAITPKTGCGLEFAEQSHGRRRSAGRVERILAVCKKHTSG